MSLLRYHADVLGFQHHSTVMKCANIFETSPWSSRTPCEKSLSCRRVRGAMVETSNRAFAEDQLRMDRADAMYAALGMPIKKPPGDDDFVGPLWGADLDGQRGELGFPMCRRATLALTTCLGACLGVDRAQLKRLLGARGFTLSFRRECLSFLDVSFVAAESLSSRKPCKFSGALLDELALVSVLASLYSANLRSPPASSQRALRLRRL